MKNTILSALLIGATFGVAQAATTITPSNFGGPATVQVQDNAGNPLTGINYEVGIMADFNDRGTFVSFGSAPFTGSPLGPGLFGTLGGPGVTGDLPNLGDAPGTFVGQNIVVLIDDPGASGEWIVWSSAATFNFETALDVGSPVGIPIGDLTLQRGQAGAPATGLGGPAVSGNGAIGVTFIIPEPSSALLLGLGGLGLLIRRKR